MTTSKAPTTAVTDFASEISDSFLANINHALRTPLNGLVGMSELLAKTGLSSNQLKYTHVIRESTELLLLQLDNIMELAKIEDGDLTINPEPYRLEDIVKAALQPLIPMSVKQGIPLSVNFAPDLPDIISADRRKLKLILTNLLSCSLKFAERGKIVLKVTREQDEDNEALFKLRFVIENSKVLYDTLNSAIEDYKDLNATDLKEFGEISVSLMTVQKLLEAMNSFISYDNLANNEPPFHFDLALKAETKTVEPTAYTSLKGKRALVFQSDILEMNTLLQSLNLWNIDYSVVSDEDKILSDLEEAYREGRSYDVFFCASFLPGKALAKLKEKVPNIIIVTDDDSLGQAFLSEFSACLRAPVYPEELLATLSSFYRDVDDGQETSLSKEASQHINNNQYDTIKAHVLIVEDDFVSRMYAAELLEGFGCKVSTAENGEYALTKLASFSDYDVIFMDCMMPRLDGYNTTRKIRESGHKDIPIIALTANTLEKDEEKCLAAGMNDYVAKPVKEQDLYAALTKALKTRQKKDR